MSDDATAILVARHRLGVIAADEAIAIASSLVDRGTASASIQELAMSSADRFEELEPLLARIAAEHGLARMTDAEAATLASGSVVAAIAAERIDAFEGGNRVWWLFGGSTIGMPADIQQLAVDALSDPVAEPQRGELRLRIIEGARRYLQSTDDSAL